LSHTLHRGSAPLLVSMPHLGTTIPAALREAYVPRALDTEDADWHLDQLYAFVKGMGASVLMPTIARYVIDLNRPPDDAPMYPGASNTELCPTRFFNGQPLYRDGAAPDMAERDRRRATYWQPYHSALAEELARIKAQHGFALLWDAHSIRAEIPWLFDGRLPDLNVGTAAGAAADTSISDAVMAACAASPAYTHVLNGRFKGGYITRQYGRPAEHVHAVQLEMCQSTYMQEVPPYAYVPKLAIAVQPTLERMVAGALGAAQALYGKGVKA
jgi:N-formylglutamate deformylase